MQSPTEVMKRKVEKTCLMVECRQRDETKGNVVNSNFLALVRAIFTSLIYRVEYQTLELASIILFSQASEHNKLQGEICERP